VAPSTQVCRQQRPRGLHAPVGSPPGSTPKDETKGRVDSFSGRLDPVKDEEERAPSAPLEVMKGPTSNVFLGGYTLTFNPLRTCLTQSVECFRNEG